MRSRATFLVGALMLAGLLSGVTASSVAAATSTTVTWRVSSLTAGQVKSLSAIATSNSSGVKTWSKKGSCTLTPKSKPTKLTMGTGISCTLTLKIAKSGKHPAKTSTKTITRKPYRVGQTGPGGGIIFYVDLTRPEGSQYFEAACAGWSDGTCGGSDLTWLTAVWGCRETSIIGADGTAIGDGEQNTADIIAADCPDSAMDTLAAEYAYDLVLGGQSDWFLPSKDELNQLYTNRAMVGGSLTCGWWSSSEFDANYAWFEVFCREASDKNVKTNPFHVRPVRSF